MSIAKVLGGAALATVGGVAAGATYLSQTPQKPLDLAESLKLAVVVGAIGIGGGILLSNKYPNLSKGLLYGGIGAAAVSTPAAKAGVFYVAALEVSGVKDALFGPKPSTVTAAQVHASRSMPRPITRAATTSRAHSSSYIADPRGQVQPGHASLMARVPAQHIPS